MYYHNKIQSFFQVLLLMACVAALSGKSQLVHAEQFEPPSLDGFNLHDERDGDGDGDGVNETRIKHYLNNNGDSLVSMSIGGVIWAWSLDTRDNDSGVRNYVIRDSDCDGVFDEVYSLDDEFHVPACIK
jgi:hypothetical protein